MELPRATVDATVWKFDAGETFDGVDCTLAVVPDF
jgi:hypothetical protein